MSAALAPVTPPRALIEALAGAARWVVLTGAGVSADSGVPTFRDAQTGLWARYDPSALATPAAFEADPTRVWDWYAWRRELVARAAPNPAHYALAGLAEIKPGLTLVTQNVDGLHQRAGSPRVIEFHGNLTRNRCFACGRLAAPPLESRRRPPPCAYCPGLLRPDVVWFGEPIPAAALGEAFAAARSADVFLSVGTAALVYPAAGLAETASDAGATIVEINRDRTPLSTAADHVLAGSAAIWLPAIASAVREAVS